MTMRKYHVVLHSEFGCKNSLISDEWREKMLTLHNENRGNLALGKEQGKNGPMPFAKNMNKLAWDCNMEEMADSAAQGCPNPPTAPTISGNGKLGFINATTTVGATCNSSEIAVTLVKELWRNGIKLQENQQYVPGNDAFAQMAYSVSMNLACTYKMCGKTFYLLCFYQKDVGTNRLYNPGSSIADLCADCGLPACVAGLCTNEFKPGKLFLPMEEYMSVL
ncbi:hypothetical protein Y032_0194g1417 [Ancylostoma ceylanicum]|uniref:SCP domain-containing protein n=1 Tax=Ancylostoma ceylanicum TaxID=53326 RepID=A0A016SPS3_9BILA|nr:hypothetical protein Y032_0194g1417 [Ancylostoma ceylanicum]